VLRYCLPASVRCTLGELPESLDETYERILKEIKKPNRAHALRVLQCLVVAIRPLRVEELAEVLAVDFDDAEGIPKLNPDWRWHDQEQALLIACSSLIAIVEDDDSRIVQFSHYSVKEFLTSSRLAIASGEASNYHIDLAPAHTTLAQACVGVLLQIQHDVEGHTAEDHPLAQYAAQHWTTHTQFEDVSSRLRKGMEYMFDQDKPHFRVWLRVYNIDTEPTSVYLLRWKKGSQSTAGPLYYAALCGFYDLVEHLIIKYPLDVNADGGYYGRPLAAALSRRHLRTADFLRHHGADPHSRVREYDRTILHIAAFNGDAEMVQKLIEYGADVNAKDTKQKTPLHLASKTDYYFLSYFNNPDFFSVHQLLLEHGADVDARAVDGSNPLWHASSRQNPEVVRLLLDHGADVNVRGEDSWTPLHQACASDREPRKFLEILRMLLDRGADVKAMDIRGRTILQLAQDHFEGKEACDEIVKLLLEHGAK
jgi:ankyrin repeat protein